MAEGKSMQLSYAEARREIYRVKIANQNLGWSPRLRQWFGYFTPDECYEATLFQMVGETTDWLDVGCGHDPFPTNQGLAALLSSRCHFLVGVDPSPNIARNTFVHESARTTIENYHSERTFDLISLRMVAEHIASPDAAIAAFSRLTKPGGRVVVYTVSKWCLPSLVAAATPLAVHHLLKKLLWNSSPDDTFPTVYRMNSRRVLLQLFKKGGFVEENYLRLNDCRALSRWWVGTVLELMLERAMRAVGLPYFDLCILGVYRKS